MACGCLGKNAHRFPRAAFPAKFRGPGQAPVPQATPHTGILTGESNGLRHLLDSRRFEIVPDPAGSSGSGS
jgi:hypothetical protein